MESQSVLNKLFNTLGNLSDDDLRKLAELFRYQNTSKAFVKMIESALGFRDATHGNKMPLREQRAKHNSIEEFEVQRSAVYHEPVNYISRGRTSKKMLYAGVASALEDRDLFPSTKDVAEVVNSQFNCGIEYEDFQKRGRRDIIGKCMQNLRKLPEKDQYTLLRDFFHKIITDRSGMNQYRELFRILTSYEKTN